MGDSNPPLLRQRVITSVLFVLVILLGTLTGKWPFILLFGLILLLCLWEYYTLVAPKDIWKDLWRKYSGIIWGTIPYIAALYLAHGVAVPGKQLGLFLLLYMTALLGWFFSPELFVRRSERFSQAALGLTGLIYIALPFGCLPLVTIVNGEYSYYQVLAILFMVWSNDSGAYLSGMRWGKRLLLPQISPKNLGRMGRWPACYASDRQVDCRISGLLDSQGWIDHRLFGIHMGPLGRSG
ncbi:MAG: phosphatidate cytidylyltransferase [Saprospiraceae bacterium]|nr:phosphatidate cytidylyltransferase [Saprospiraceae bacterium]